MFSTGASSPISISDSSSTSYSSDDEKVPTKALVPRRWDVINNISQIAFAMKLEDVLTRTYSFRLEYLDPRNNFVTHYSSKLFTAKEVKKDRDNGFDLLRAALLEKRFYCDNTYLVNTAQLARVELKDPEDFGFQRVYRIDLIFLSGATARMTYFDSSSRDNAYNALLRDRPL